MPAVGDVALARRAAVLPVEEGRPSDPHGEQWLQVAVLVETAARQQRIELRAGSAEHRTFSIRRIQPLSSKTSRSRPAVFALQR